MVLVVVAIAQLMVVLDATIVNIALPSAQHSLGFPNSDRQWVVTAYALAFGSLLLPGGRIGDMFSRKRVFIHRHGRIRHRLGPRGRLRPAARR
jgi:MFS family permease